MFRERAKFADEIPLIARYTQGKSVNLGVYLSTPEGEGLGSFLHLSGEDQNGQILAILKKGLAKMGTVEPREPAPRVFHADRGVGTREDGSVRLALWVRFVDPAPHGKHAPVYDSIVLDAKQWGALLPAKLEEGERFQVPAGTAHQLARALVASSDLSFMFRPGDIRGGAIDAEVVSKTRIRLGGNLSGRRAHVNEPDKPNDGGTRFTGELTLDETGRPAKLLLVGEGTYQQPWDRKPRPIASVVEWSASK